MIATNLKKLIPDDRTRLIAMAAVMLLLLLILWYVGKSLLKKVDISGKGTSPTNGGEGGIPGTGLPAGTSPELSKLVADTMVQTAKSYNFCYGAGARCEVWKRWLALQDLQFTAAANMYAQQAEQTIRESIGLLNCNVVCSEVTHPDRIIERLDRLKIV